MRLALIPLALFVVSCASEKAGILLPQTEVVMVPGMVITATNPNGNLSIRATGKATRTFSGTGWTNHSRLIPRRTRWYGSLGLYDPAPSYSPYGRLLVDEGRLFFGSESEALRYLYVGSTYFKPVFTNNGLVVGYHVEPISGGEATRSVQLWQIYIDGKKPTTMRGANDSVITVTGGSTPTSASPNPAPVGYVKTLGKVEYKP